MANVIVNLDRTHEGQLTVNTIDELRFNAGRNYSEVDVINRDGTAELFVRVDGQAPTIGGADGDYVVPAAIGQRRIPWGPNIQIRSTAIGIPKYGIEGVIPGAGGED